MIITINIVLVFAVVDRTFFDGATEYISQGNILTRSYPSPHEDYHRPRSPTVGVRLSLHRVRLSRPRSTNIF